MRSWLFISASVLVGLANSTHASDSPIERLDFAWTASLETGMPFEFMVDLVGMCDEPTAVVDFHLAEPGYFSPLCTPDGYGPSFIPDDIGPSFIPDDIGPSFIPDGFGPSFIPDGFGPSFIPDGFDLPNQVD